MNNEVWLIILSVGLTGISSGVVSAIVTIVRLNVKMSLIEKDLEALKARTNRLEKGYYDGFR